jgi:hypothetical protein
MRIQFEPFLMHLDIGPTDPDRKLIRGGDGGRKTKRMCIRIQYVCSKAQNLHPHLIV